MIAIVSAVPPYAGVLATAFLALKDGAAQQVIAVKDKTLHIIRQWKILQLDLVAFHQRMQ